MQRQTFVARVLPAEPKSPPGQNAAPPADAALPAVEMPAMEPPPAPAMAQPKAPPTAAPPVQPDENPPAAAESAEVFLRQNPETGFLKVQVFTAGQALPVADAQVWVEKDFAAGSHAFHFVKTDADGVTGGLALPAPKRPAEPVIGRPPPFADYRVRVEKPGFREAVFPHVPVYGGIRSIQPVDLQPKGGDDRAG
ncbi:MAG: hypothetical protein IJP03_03360 [Christensenellaceae bacterium]|nr:hypothetical protein [Christensenellaceae bacterium]